MERRLIWLLVSEFSLSMASGCIVPRAGEGSACTLTARGRTNGQSWREVKRQEGLELDWPLWRQASKDLRPPTRPQGSKDRVTSQ